MAVDTPVKSRTRRRRRRVVVHLLSGRRARRAGVSRLRHPRSRRACDVRGSVLPAVARPAAESRRAGRAAVAAGRVAAAAGRCAAAHAVASAVERRWTRCARWCPRCRTTIPAPTTCLPEGRYRTSVKLTAQIGTDRGDLRHGSQRAAASSSPIPRSATPRISCTC